jgi:FMN-dependent oxidoreductase (nitrilotriacetate monooxygenase family)
MNLAPTWTPRAQEGDYNTIAYWTRLARTCEDALLDGIFLADALGIADVYRGSPAAMLKSGSFVPSMDPMLLVPVMAAVTRHLSFGITGNTTYETPYLLARRFSTLDHLSQGRVAWNVVTGVLEATSKAVGLRDWVPHDQRYKAADEFMQLTYKLWEQSWDDDAARRDKQSGTFSDPAKIRAIAHDGKYYQCHGIHLAEPSPQRTPLIFAAGSSPAGMDFLARHAECGFISAGSKEAVRRTVQAIRDKATQHGRHGEDIKIFLGMTIVAAPTEARARALQREYDAHSDLEGNLAFKSGYAGVDFSRYALDDPLPNQKTNASQSALAQYASKTWTIRDLGKFEPMEGREVFLVGSASQVSDQIIDWVDQTGIDGINLIRTVEPEGLDSFCRLVVPELQERGAFKTGYREGPLREKLFAGSGGRAWPRHPARRKDV